MPEREESAEELNDDLRQALNCYIEDSCSDLVIRITALEYKMKDLQEASKCYIEDSCSDLVIRITALENKIKDLQDDIGRFIAAYYLIKKILERHEAEIKKIQEGQH